jgi:hypothetical protein
MLVAASVFFLAAVTYAVWCMVVAFGSGFQIGTLGMALLSWALCYEGFALLRGRSSARVPGLVGAAALTIGCSGSAALISLPWLSSAAEVPIPKALWLALVVLLASAAAFAVAAICLIYDYRAPP